MSLRTLLDKKKNLLLLGASSPIEALQMEALGYEAAYISGAVLSTTLGLLDEGKISRNKMANFVREIRNASDLPLLVDCDTGLLSKKEMATKRVDEDAIIRKTVGALEIAGADAIQIEDQVPSKKRCGHLDGKEVISMGDMSRKIRLAALKRKSKNFLIVARTDARAPEGLDNAIWRAEHYVKAGADIIFPEALESEDEFRKFREAVPQIPLVANLAEGGKTPGNLTTEKLFSLGYQIVLIPATPLRLMLRFYGTILKHAKDIGSLYYAGDRFGILSRGDLIEFIKNNSKVYKK
ncbi:MAG: isocitrate lyase/phosphoenolpyruvate mutase family protein [bacterium]|nr:isocitrate lyase/phosphoenolpyruvate mutase family protein [bacterium]